MTATRSALILDAGFASLPLQRAVKAAGFTTLVCSGKPHDAGMKAADTPIVQNYADYDAVLDVARNYAISAITPGVTDVSYLTGSRVAAGEEIYAQNCASCHGPVQGPVVLAAAPVHGDAGHTWHHPDRLLHQWVLDRPPLATVMPAFRGVLSDEQVLEVLAYIKSTWLPQIQERQDLGSRQYEAQVIEDGTE